MEAAKTTSTENISGENEAQFPRARQVLRGIAKRRLERRGRQMARNVRGRAKAFGRGARLGYAIQENPGRAVVMGFVLGCAIGAIGLALSHIVQDFQTLIDEENLSDEQSGSDAAA